MISIHAPRVGSDHKCGTVLLNHLAFQSTLPVWGATFRLAYVYQCYLISIHAPRVGSDFEIGTRTRALKIISIHAPRVGSDCYQP